LFEVTGPVLVLGAHTDDEFGCAGTIARLLEEGAQVHYACFSSCEESVPAGFPKTILKDEVLEAIDILGIQRELFYLYDYPVRHFPAHRQEILEELIKLRNRIHPAIVFLPAFSDMHQDHSVIAHEGLRAFKNSTLLGYELPMNTIAFQHACFVRLGPEHMDIKLRHAAVYRSQSVRPYLREEFIQALAVVRGTQISQSAAEAFEVVRMAVL
jgi:LmbE family N-acetylglucosaminyl deacetylase